MIHPRFCFDLSAHTKNLLQWETGRPQESAQSEQNSALSYDDEPINYL